MSLVLLLLAACAPLAMAWAFCTYRWTPGRHAEAEVVKRAVPYRPTLPGWVRFRHAARRPLWA